MARAVVFSLAIGVLACAPRGPVKIEIDPSQTFQTMRGWEAVAGAPEDSPAFDSWIGPLLDRAVNEVGINRVQVQVRAGAEHDLDNWSLWRQGSIEYRQWRQRRYATVNDNEDPDLIDWNGFHFSEVDYQVENFVLPLRELLAAHGESLYVTLLYVAFTPQTKDGSYHHLDTSEYSEFILAAFKHLEETYGFVPDALEVVLEPENVPGWNEAHMGGAIVAVTDRLHASGYVPDIIAPSVTKMAHAAWFIDVWAEAGGILDRVHTLSYHRYRGFRPRDLREIAELAAEHGLETAMLEWWDKRNGYRTLHEDLKIGMNSAWHQGNLGGRDGPMSLYRIDDSDPGKPVITINTPTKFTRQYFKFIRHGAKRIGAASSHRALDPLAFVSQDGGFVVVVKADRAVDFTISGLPAGTYGATHATGADWDVTHPDQAIDAGMELSTSIPGEGVITIFAR